jgi:hypothetical protein
MLFDCYYTLLTWRSIILYIKLFLLRLLGYEGLEVINPEGGTEDAEAEALRGRWKQEVL